jgi:hypothetical protein
LTSYGGAQLTEAREPENTDKCLDGPSVLCDLTNNCANGADENEQYCDEMPDGAKCDFDTPQIQNGDTCGWHIPQQHDDIVNKIPENVPSEMNDKHEGGGSSLHIKLQKEPNEKVILWSPIFPPPPKYNSNNRSPFLESCKVRLDYHTNIESSTLQGSMHW